MEIDKNFEPGNKTSIPVNTPTPTQHPQAAPPPPPPPAPPPPPLPVTSNPPTSKERMKKLNWQAIKNPPKDCFWASLPSVAQDSDIFDGLKQRFSLPHVDTNESSSSGAKSISLRVLDGNTAQNLLISFHALFKTATYEQIKQEILRCDTSNLNSTLIETLIKFLPQHKIEKLCEMNKKNVELSNVEKFVARLGEVDRIVPRLNCMNFKLCFNDLVQDLEPDLKAGTTACKEIISSKKFGEILSLILTIGNFMNSGHGKASGFDLEVLKKLHDIKSAKHKQTLLHFIVKTIQQKFPELLNFGEEITHVDDAARICFDKINETIQTIVTSSQKLQKELEYGHESKLPEDKFVEVMKPFSLECDNQVQLLTKMFNEMHNSYTIVGKHFAFDLSKCPIEECFSNIKIFKTQFSKVLKEIDIETKEMACPTKNSQLVDKQKEPSSAEAEIAPLTMNSSLDTHESRECVVKLHLSTKTDIVPPTMNSSLNTHETRECVVKLHRLTKTGSGAPANIVLGRTDVQLATKPRPLT
ncbi:protein diaphanous-like, partial [Sitodiplosis mosellana]|uniref:protein diaphanous-like n=1 Tax=Sitodiplosis mosellana TaxID=263140 RepID=UPI002444D16F